MLDMLRKRQEDEEGFTLIELMVVVLIIAILLAIAIPTFLGARERAQNRAAQSDIRNALTAEKVFYTDAQTFTSGAAGLVTLKGIEPSLTFVAAGTPVKTSVGISTTTDNNAVCVEKLSASNTAYSLIDIGTGVTAGTYYNDAACPALGAAASTTTPLPYAGWVTTGF